MQTLLLASATSLTYTTVGVPPQSDLENKLLLKTTPPTSAKHGNHIYTLLTNSIVGCDYCTNASPCFHSCA